MRRFACAAVVAWTLASPTVAASREAATRLVVHRSADAQECPDARALAVLVDKLVGHPALDPEGKGDSSVSIEVDFARSESGYAAGVITHGKRSGRRDLRDDSGPGCAGLADALALTISLILDTMEGPTKPEPRVSLPRVVAAPTPPAWRGTVEGDAALTAGLLHSMRPAGLFGFDLSAPQGHCVGVGLLWPASDSVNYGPGHVDLSLWAITARACAAVVGDRSSTRLLLCAVPAFGGVHAAGQGYTTTASTRRPWIALGGEVAAQGWISDRFGWTLRTGILVPTRDESFSIEGLGIAHRPYGAGGFLSGGIRVSIW